MKIFIGFDSTAAAAYFIQRQSILTHNPNLDVRPLVKQLLVMQGLYRRPHDPLASTEFTYTRFLVPYLCHYDGWALFMDGDMLVRDDLKKLLAYARDDMAVGCVRHSHAPRESVKMIVDGKPKVQTVYPRKNWSSLMLFNCAHSDCRSLTVAVVNCALPSYLHQMKWATDDHIFELPKKWNWLEGYDKVEVDPAVVHFTRGIPGIHDGCSQLPFADEYIELARLMPHAG